MIHHTFHATGLTSCERPVADVEATGLDSRVDCPRCELYLHAYREIFPLASNREDEYGRPLMIGGAR